MDKKLIFVVFFLLLLVACGKKSDSIEKESLVIDKISGTWVSDEKNYIVEIKSMNESDQMQIIWNGEKIQTRYVEESDYNELIFESLDLDKWNIEFYIKPLEDNQLLISTSSVKGNQASDSKPITYKKEEN